MHLEGLVLILKTPAFWIFQAKAHHLITFYLMYPEAYCNFTRIMFMMTTVLVTQILTDSSFSPKCAESAVSLKMLTACWEITPHLTTDSSGTAEIRYSNILLTQFSFHGTLREGTLESCLNCPRGQCETYTSTEGRTWPGVPALLLDFPCFSCLRDSLMLFEHRFLRFIV